jgi:hypothetical protein
MFPMLEKLEKMAVQSWIVFQFLTVNGRSSAFALSKREVDPINKENRIQKPYNTRLI